jgi:siroheme synthase
MHTYQLFDPKQWFIATTTSAVAAPLAVGIPLTAPGLVDRITLITGLGEDSDLSGLDFDPAATVVGLIPMRSLDDLARRLIRDYGYPTNWPIAVVEQALFPGQRAVRAPLHAIGAVAQNLGIQGSVVVVLGTMVRRAKSTVFVVDYEAEMEVRVA